MQGIGSIIIYILLFLLLIVAAYFKRPVKDEDIRESALDENTIKKFERVYAEPTERYIASLGNGYIINYLAGNSFASGFSVISNKRVYFKGKCYYKEQGKLKQSFEERTVDLKDVTGTGYTRTNPINILISAIVSLVTSLISFIATIQIGSDIPPIILIVSLFTFCILLINYLVKRMNLFEISFAGGKIAFNTDLYDKSEIDDFQKQLRRAKDYVMESASTQIAATLEHQKSKENNSKIGVADELIKYADLLKQNLITQEEYDNVKKALISGNNE